MDMFDGFVFLEEKKKSLIPILCQYDFLSALTAAFSITSWRKNRGAQESCLALNSAMEGLSLSNSVICSTWIPPAKTCLYGFGLHSNGGQYLVCYTHRSHIPDIKSCLQKDLYGRLLLYSYSAE